MTTARQHHAFKVLQHANGIVEICFEPQPRKTVSAQDVVDFLALADDWLARDAVRAITYHATQDKMAIEPDYMALVHAAMQTDDFVDDLRQINTLSKKMRTHEKPLIALLHGDCLGDYFAWALLADYRIAIGAAGNVGFPETAFGMLPGLGSVSRMWHLWGEDFALRLATQTVLYDIPMAFSLGIIDEQVENIADLQNSIIAFLYTSETENLQSQYTIKEKRAQLPPARVNPLFSGAIACQKLLITYKEAEDLNALVLQEHHLYLQVTTSDAVIAMIRTHYYGMREAREKIKHISENSRREIRNIGVIGAGMMGSGIAYESACAGLHVTLIDTDLAKANHGKSYAQKVTDKLISQQKMDVSTQSKLLQRIRTSERFEDVHSADILIEAVFEDLDLKTKLIANVSSYLDKRAIFASNTTSLPIGKLAAASQNPAAFIGLHFFSPVDRMPLVEVILGKETDETTKNAALKCIHLLNKIPIVVQDGPGFFTSRIFFNYLLEGITMVLEGVPSSVVEKVAREAGFPVGPLLVLDEISLPLMLHVYDQLPALHDAQQAAYAYLHQMIATGKTGRKGNAGFYLYDANGKRGKILEDISLREVPAYDGQSLAKRLLHVVALDAFRCLSDGIIAQPIDGDLGSVLGIGFAPHTGGVFAHIDHVGLAEFVTECERFASHGAQWEIPSALRDLAMQKFAFYDGFRSNWNPS